MFFQKNLTIVRDIVEVSFIISLACIFDYIIGNIFRIIWAQGGSITIRLCFFVLIFARYKLSLSLCAIFVYSLLHFFVSFFFLNFYQLLLDYLVPYYGYILCYYFRKMLFKKNILAYVYFIIIVFFSWLFNFACNFTSGVLFYGKWNINYSSVYLYSFVYNISSMAPSYFISVLLLISFKKNFIYFVLKGKEFYLLKPNKLKIKKLNQKNII